MSPRTCTPGATMCCCSAAGDAAQATPATSSPAAAALSTANPRRAPSVCHDRQLKQICSEKRSFRPSDRIRTLVVPMENATWTIVPCRAGRACARSCRSSASATTAASVLARRGYADPSRARRLPRGRAAGPRPVPARRHARPRSARSAAAVAAGERICVHGDYDADGICATALAVLPAARARADAGLAPALALRGGLRPVGRDGRAARRRGRRAGADRRLRHHRRRRGRARARARARRRRHRPPPAGRDVPRLPGRGAR